MKACVLVLAGVLCCLAAGAQDEKANLSGVWKRSQGGGSTVYRIDQQGAALTLRLQSQYPAGALTAGINGTETYTADGVERESKNDAGRESWTTVSWQAQSLVILRIVKDGYRVTVTREAWTLSDDGRAMTRSKRTIDLDKVSESSEVFERQ